MPKVVIEVPDWVDEKMKEYLQRVIHEKIDEILVEAAWERALEKPKATDEDIEQLSEAIKESAWRKLEKELKERGIIDDN